MDLIHVKLKTGTDLLGYLESVSESDIHLVGPVEISIDPNLGFFAKSWLLLSEITSVRIMHSDMYFYSKASEKAFSYYEEFVNRLNEVSKNNLDHSSINEFEDIFVAMMESNGSIKH
jgi:hypothetical protein